MSEATGPKFPRGIVRMQEIVGRVRPLATFLVAYQPNARRICLPAEDLQYIFRWQPAAALAGFTVDAHGAEYLGLTLYSKDGAHASP